MAFEKILPFLKTVGKPKEAEVQPKPEVCALEKEEALFYKTRAAVYRKIIERYAEAINGGEEKTLPELKALIKPFDPAVQDVKIKLLESILQGRPYDFEKDFQQAAEASFQRVKSLHFVHADLPVSYWLSPAEIIELGAADPFDRALLYCSLLIALGCKEARVRVVEIEGGIRHPLVFFSFGGKTFLSDPTQDKTALEHAGTADELIAAFELDGKKVSRSLFEFNDQDYQQFEEGG